MLVELAGKSLERMGCLAWGWCLVVLFILGSIDPPTPYVFFAQGFVCRVSVGFGGSSV